MPEAASNPGVAQQRPNGPADRSGERRCLSDDLLDGSRMGAAIPKRGRLWRLMCLCLLFSCSRVPESGSVTDQFQQGMEAMERGDYAEAYCAWRPLAQEGHVEAQYNLGWFYANGYGVQVNPPKAVEWWRRAAEQGHTEARFALGMTYASGDGLERDLAQAIPWLVDAARQGHEDAQDVLRKTLRENSGRVPEALPLLADQEWLGAELAVTGDRTNARAGPGIGHEVVTRFNKGAAVREVARSGAWVLVLSRQPLALVWIHSSLLH